jgi:opacity protein-like surface antigen
MRLGIGAQLGAWIPFRDTNLYMFGASLGVQYFATDKLILDAVFSLPALVGGSAVADGVDLRTFTLGVAYAF